MSLPGPGWRLVEQDEIIDEKDMCRRPMPGASWAAVHASAGRTPRQHNIIMNGDSLVWATQRPPAVPAKPVEKEWVDPWD